MHSQMFILWLTRALYHLQSKVCSKMNSTGLTISCHWKFHKVFVQQETWQNRILIALVGWTLSIEERKWVYFRNESSHSRLETVIIKKAVCSYRNQGSLRVARTPIFTYSVRHMFWPSFIVFKIMKSGPKHMTHPVVRVVILKSTPCTALQ